MLLKCDMFASQLIRVIDTLVSDERRGVVSGDVVMLVNAHTLHGVRNPPSA